MQWKASAPYMDISIDGIQDSGKKIYAAFKDYAKALEACITEQMPPVLENAEQLPHRAEEAKEHAKSELEALDVMKKAKAVMAIGFNLKVAAKIPSYVKNCAEGIKGDLQEVKDAIDDLKANLNQLAINGAKCAAAEKFTPLECYKLIYGPIKYT
jgi:hypothetical protein